MSTTINPGLEIWHLSFKDDSFRMSEWYDNIVGNQITFYNGTVKTTGITGDFSINPLNLPSLVLTNGDEVTLPAFSDIKKTFGTEYTIIPVPYRAIQSIRLRAKNLGSIGTLTVILLDQTFVPIVGGSVTVTLSSSLYTHYTVPISLSQSVAGIELVNTVDCMVDYVAFATSDYLNQGGDSLNVTIPKKTAAQTIPNASDVIQQIGIGSRSKAVDIPKSSTAAYRWLEDKLVNSVPIELITPTEQATGYLSDISRYSEAGWVGTPLPTTDAMSSNPAVAQELYDLSVSLTKADNEQNIYTIIPPIPPVVLGLGGTLSPPQRKLVFASGLWWMFYSINFNIVYQASSDGVNWTPAFTITTVPQTGYGANFAIWNSGTTLYYVANNTNGAASFKWGYGTMNVDGSITWTIIEATVSTTYLACESCSIALDTSGNVWVITNTSSGISPPNIGNYTEIWEYSSGTWTQQFLGYFPSSYGNPCVVVPLTSGKMAFIYGISDSGYVQIKMWSGSSFITPRDISQPFNDSTWSVISIGDTIYFAGYYANQVFSLSCLYGDFVSSPVLVNSLVAGEVYCSLSFNTSTSELVLFTASNLSTINYYTSTDLGVFWSGATTFDSSSIDAQGPISNFSTSTGTYGIGWMNTNPFSQLKFAILTI